MAYRPVVPAGGMESVEARGPQLAFPRRPWTGSSGAGGSSGSPGSTGQTQRTTIVGAALRCIARHGISKTTVDDVAGEAGVSRATIYRVFPGGKDAVLAAVSDTEMARLFSAIGVEMGEAEDLTEVLVAGIAGSSRFLEEHQAIGYLLAYEPEVVLRRLAFDACDELLAVATGFVAPYLARWMSMEEARRIAEWGVRIVLSYLVAPAPGIRLSDPVAARHVVETFVLPGVRALRVADPDAPIDLTVAFGPRGGPGAGGRGGTSGAAGTPNGEHRPEQRQKGSL
ncbi:MAG: TetR/AcrR family transcriptional regulator [Actinomycetota bacterium]|nr:TetR/AcrR family transcriptional regulator [Actinomycetota bacterium]